MKPKGRPTTKPKDRPQVTEVDIEGLETKLQTMTESLAPGERAALERLLALAAAGHGAVQGRGDEVEGFLWTTLQASSLYLARRNRVNLLRSTLAPRLAACGGSSCSQCKGKGGSSYDRPPGPGARPGR